MMSGIEETTHDQRQHGKVPLGRSQANASCDKKGKSKLTPEDRGPEPCLPSATIASGPGRLDQRAPRVGNTKQRFNTGNARANDNNGDGTELNREGTWYTKHASGKVKTVASLAAHPSLNAREADNGPS